MKKFYILFLVIILTSKISFAKNSTVNINDSIKIEKLEQFIDFWWKTPYKFGGETKKGIDCSAFIRQLYKDVYNIDLPRTSREQYKKGKSIKKEDLAIGDLIFFKSRKGLWHVGMYMGDGNFLHSGVKYGVYISSLSEYYYSKNYFSQKRLL